MKHKITIALILTFISIAIFWACKDEELPYVTGINKIELTITEDSTSYVFTEITCVLNKTPNFAIEQYGFCWDTIANVNIEKQTNNFSKLTSQTFQKNIESLLPNKTYYVKAYIQNGDVVIYSNELTIYTLDARPIVITSEITNILGNSAESGGTVNAYETLFPITQRGVCWAKTQNPDIADSLTVDSLGNGNYNSKLLNLEIGANYFVRAYAINSEGISYGEEKSFSTLDGVPDLTTDSIKNITATSATFYGNIIENDGLEIIEKGFCWNTSTNPTIANNIVVVTGNVLGSFLQEITSLEVIETYYVKAYMKNSEGTFYGNEISFSTNDGIPDLTTVEATNIAATSVTSGGNITDDGGFAITVRGVCWSTSTNPVNADAHTTDGTGTGSFISNLTGLNINTAYYVRAYATNTNGTVYGNEISFTTNDGIPDLTTAEATNITSTSATGGGNITDNGGFAITARGVCWSTITNPAITDAHTTDGAGTGSFTSSLTGLTELMTYYVRAYATNENVTVYGNEVSFIARNTVSDYDGNIYGIVTIGTQTWMEENLKTTHYSDGTAIQLVESSTSWSALGYTDKAMCYYDNSLSHANTYGALYTWAAAMNGATSGTVQGVCPDGWHLPSDGEWKELEVYLGMSQAEADAESWRGMNEGSKLAGNPELWSNGDLENDVEFGTSGFSALPAGRRHSDGLFYNLSTGANFWTATEYSYPVAWSRCLNSIYTGVYRSKLYNYTDVGYSVRCIKD